MEASGIGVLVFMTVFLGVMALSRRAHEQEAVAARLLEIEQHRAPRAMVLTLPFYRRALLPFITSLVNGVIRFSPPKSIATVRGNLAKAGHRHGDPVMWILLKWLRAGLLGFGVYAAGLLSHQSALVQLPLALACGGLGYLWPEYAIRRTIAARQMQLIKELPDTLDLLTVSVEAGLGLDQALEVVARRRKGPLAEEIQIYLDEVGLGRDRHDALKAIGTRTGLEDLVSLTATLVQALEFGVSIATVLRIQSDDVRTRRRQRIEERAMKAPVKMLFPLIFLILPALFVVVAGPGLIRAYIEFIQPGGPGTFSAPVKTIR